MDDISLAPIPLDIKKTVKKSNMLNEIRNANASLVEYRLFCVYLAHLPMNADSNVVTFTLADYAKIAGLKRPRAEDLEEQSDNLLDLKARIPSPDGGFWKRTMFSEFALFKQDGEWMVSLECNPKIAPMIREQSGRFLRYKLYNTIFLKSYNQQRLYELLKQYERIGERTITLKDLREFLSIEDSQYPVWGVFARDVLKKGQQALKEYTDICFEFEPIRASRRGKPVVSVKFIISKNEDFVDKLQISQHLPDADNPGDYDGDELRKKAPAEDDVPDIPPADEGEPVDPDQTSIFDDDYDYYQPEPAPEDPIQLSIDALPSHLTREQVLQLRELARPHMPFPDELPYNDPELWFYQYFTQKVSKMVADEVKFQNYFAWLKKAVANNWL